MIQKRDPKRDQRDGSDSDQSLGEPWTSLTPRESLLGQIVLLLLFIIAILLRSLSYVS